MQKKSRMFLGSAAQATKIAEDRDREAACANHGSSCRLPACGPLESHLLPEPAACCRAANEATQAPQESAPCERASPDPCDHELGAVLGHASASNLDYVAGRGKYLCHWRTMYAILNEIQRDTRSAQSTRPPAVQEPEMLATAPNQAWSWDTTKLRGPQKWTRYTLYVMLDIFSRYVVDWMVVPGESADLAREFINTTCMRQGVSPHQLVIHCDRGAPMVSKTYTQLLADLGVNRSFSRPYRSNDNAFSETQFKTMKYHTGYPDRFGSLQDARNWINRSNSLCTHLQGRRKAKPQADTGPTLNPFTNHTPPWALNLLRPHEHWSHFAMHIPLWFVIMVYNPPFFG